MKPENPPIGEVECPTKGCSQRCKVYAFKPRTAGRNSVFTGKKYLVCPDHGRIGADGSQRITDYILENGTIWGAKKPDAKPENTAKNPDPPRAAPSPKPVPKTPQPVPGRSGVSKPEIKPASPEKKPWWEPLI